MRFPLLLTLAVLTLGGCGKPMPQTVSRTPPLNMARLDADIGAIAKAAAPGVLGVGLINLESGQSWSLNGERRFPMQSVFKAPLGAAALAEVDGGRLDLDETLKIGAQDLSPPHSPIADAWPARTDYTLRELLTAAVGESDNTAADVLMRRIGGPGVVNAWLQDKHVQEVRIDRYERELQPQIAGMASFRPQWKGQAAFNAALNSVPPDLRRKATAAYLADPRDTATPSGMLDFLYRLEDGQLLKPASKALLLATMSDSTRISGRLRAGLPANVKLAHKPGSARTDLGMTPATNDVGIFTLPDGRRYAIAVFLSGSTLDGAGRDKVIADVARVVAHSLG